MISGASPWIVRIKVSGEIRTIHRNLWEKLEGPKPVDLLAFPSNGCTCSPDYLRGFAFWAACYLHDYHTTAASPVVMARREADTLLRRNIETLLLGQGCGYREARIYAYLYFRGVRAGGRHFYSGKGDPAE